MLNSACVSQLTFKRHVNHLTALKRRTSRAGKESIDHTPVSHDDFVKEGAGAVALRPIAGKSSPS
jgi:hypothetical protein